MSDQPRGYMLGAPIYRAAGWVGVLPVLPGKGKTPVGTTGWLGKYPDDAQIARWCASHFWRFENLTLRLSPGQLGIDIDAYDDKTGAQTLNEGENRHGPLPPTFRSTSRLDDPVSGIRIFKVPEDYRSVSVLGFPELGIGHIELIQPHHRQINCWPSIHAKTRNMYRWFDPDDKLMPEGMVPLVADVPELQS